jgi:hypothetical protein
MPIRRGFVLFEYSKVGGLADIGELESNRFDHGDWQLTGCRSFTGRGTRRGKFFKMRHIHRQTEGHLQLVAGGTATTIQFESVIPFILSVVLHPSRGVQRFPLPG